MAGNQPFAPTPHCVEPICPSLLLPADLDASEDQRVQAYSTPDAAELATVYDIVHKLACVAQSFAATTGGAGSIDGDVRSLQKQLRRLKAEAEEALEEAQAPAGLPAL